MEFKHYFAAYFIWLLFNRTLIFENIQKKWKAALTHWETKCKVFFVIRYVTTVCASCGTLWCNIFPSLLFGDIFDLLAFFCLTFTVETLLSSLNQLVKQSKKHE